MDKIKKLSEPIELARVQLRIGTTNYSKKGFSLLAYKDSRVDVERLNNVFGVHWKDEYRYDQKGNLVCRISIWDIESEQWISREGVGIESYTEKIKGSYSDALKRAGFRWGIGIELYNMPFMWIQWEKWKKNQKGNQVPAVYVKDWSLKKEEGQYLVYDGKGNQMWPKKKKKTTPTKTSRKSSSDSKKQKGEGPVGPFKKDGAREKALEKLRKARKVLLASDSDMTFIEACNNFATININSASEVKELSTKQIKNIRESIYEILEAEGYLNPEKEELY